MKRLFITLLLSVVLFSAHSAQAQGSLSVQGDITSVGATTNGGLTGGAVRGAALLGLLTTCGDGQILKWTAGTASWGCAADSSVSDGDKGDITVSASGASWVIDAAAVTLAKMANIPTQTFIGRTTAAAGVPEALTATQATAMLDAFTTLAKGLAPASGGGTVNYLRADGTYAAPPGAGDITGVTVTSPGCAAGSFVATLTGGAASGDAPVGGTCVAEVGDISAVTTTANMGLTGGGTSGAVSVGLIPTCADGQVLKSGATGTTWSCANDTGETTIAGAGLTLTGSTVDVVGSSDFSIGADLIDLSTAVTAPGSLAVATTLGITGLSTLTGGYNSSAGTSTVGDFRGTVISPAAITGLIADWAPTGLSTATVIRVASTGAVDLTGITGGVDGRELVLINISASFTINIYNDNSNSVAANRILNPDALTWQLRRDNSTLLRYDGTSARWRVVSIATTQMPRLYVNTITDLVGAVGTYGNTVIGDALTDTLDITAKISSHLYFAGTAPTLSGCQAAATIVGNDRRGKITVGTIAAAPACTVTFVTPWSTNAPICQATPGVVVNNASIVQITAASTTAVTFTPRSATSGDTFYYNCDGIIL